MSIVNIVPANSSSSVNLSVTWPDVSSYTGKKALFILTHANNDTFTPAAGWSAATYSQAATGFGMFAFEKTIAGTETGTTDTFVAAKTGRKAAFLIITDNESIDAFAISSVSAASTSIAHPTVTATGNVDVIRVFHASGFDGITYGVADFTPAGTPYPGGENYVAASSTAYIGISEDTGTAGSVGGGTSTCTPSCTLASATIALVSAFTPPSITDIDSDESVTDGQGTATLTTSDFSGEINSVTVSDGTYTSSNLFDGGTGGSYTWNVTDIANQVGDSASGQPNWFTGTLTLTAGDGTDTDDESLTWNPASGWTTVVLADDDASEGSVSYNRGAGAYPDGTIIYYDTADSSEVFSNGQYATSKTSIHSAYAYLVATGVIEHITIDPVAPTVTGITVGTDGETVSVAVDKACEVGAGGSGGWTVGGYALTYQSGSNPLIFTSASTIYQGATPTSNYTQPGNGIQATASGNDLASFTGEPVTNNSEQPAPAAGTFREFFGPASFGTATLGGSGWEVSIDPDNSTPDNFELTENGWDIPE